MKNRIYGIGLIRKACPLSPAEQTRPVAEAGFGACFLYWQKDETEAAARAVKEHGLMLQSIHAPYRLAAELWKSDAEAAGALSDLYGCLEDCARFGAPIMVMHPYKGFDTEDLPTEAGTERFLQLAAAAKRLGVRLAVENLEREDFLKALMDASKGDPTVGFCWDSGHELCYNRQDMLALYGDRLIATHLNDNLGVADPAGRITSRDDLHLLPFDGNVDWEDAAARLARCFPDGPLTFELKLESKKDRHENDFYRTLSPECFFALAYERAERFAALLDKAEKL